MSGQQWQEFLQMGGYAFQVWGAYLAVPALVLLEVVLLGFRRRVIHGHLGWRTAAGSMRRFPAVRPELVEGQSGSAFMVTEVLHERRSLHSERRSLRNERRSQHREQVPPHNERRSQHNERRSSDLERRSAYSQTAPALPG